MLSYLYLFRRMYKKSNCFTGCCCRPDKPAVYHQFDNGIHVNPQVKNVFIGSYSANELVLGPQFHWTIFSFDENNTFYPVNLISNLSRSVFGKVSCTSILITNYKLRTCSGMNTSEIIIHSSFFANYSMYNRFGLKLKVTSDNRPPCDRYCT